MNQERRSFLRRAIGVLLAPLAPLGVIASIKTIKPPLYIAPRITIWQLGLECPLREGAEYAHSNGGVYLIEKPVCLGWRVDEKGHQPKWRRQHYNCKEYRAGATYLRRT